MRVEFEWGIHNLTLDSPLVEIASIHSWDRDNHAHPTAEEKAECPSKFRCYMCLERKDRSHLGGKLAGKRICDTCYPHQDAWDVGCLILFDRKSTKDKPSFFVPKSKGHNRLNPLQVEELERRVKKRIKRRERAYG